ncbi:MAG TPA: site-specific integrase [Pyrinomonadaceae bacterium]|jgi:integrase
MGKRRTGYVWEISGKWYARFTYQDGSGKRRNVKWLVEGVRNQTEAEDDLIRVLKEFEDRGERALDGNRMLFRNLAKIYEERKLIPAEYVGERKVAGLRSWKTPKTFLRTLVEHFGACRIRDITKSDIEDFKLKRLKTPTIRNRQRTIASVNRELELLRAMLRFAHSEGWISRTPHILINKADENERMRILSQQEELKLLASCHGKREHLKPLLIAALDTAMRRGELFKLRWSEVNLEKFTIYIKAMNTRSPHPRTVGITPRLGYELERLYESSPKDPNCLVFGVKDTVKRSFTSACRAAGIEGFRFHDCRHTAITRMLRSGLEAAEVMKVSGHTQWKTFLRYVNPDEVAAKEFADQLAAYNDGRT